MWARDTALSEIQLLGHLSVYHFIDIIWQHYTNYLESHQKQLLGGFGRLDLTCWCVLGWLLCIAFVVNLLWFCTSSYFNCAFAFHPYLWHIIGCHTFNCNLYHFLILQSFLYTHTILWFSLLHYYLLVHNTFYWQPVCFQGIPTVYAV